MDKLREFWRKFKRFHFWVLCALVALIGVSSWFMATRSLRAESESNKNAIEQTYTKASSFQSLAPYPNDNVMQEMDKLINTRVTEIRDAWKKMEDQQKDVFRWPDIDGGSIRNLLADKYPIERSVPFPLTRENDVLTLTQREAYRDHIFEQLRSLAGEIGSEWTANVTTESSGTGSSTTSARDLVVVWEEANQKELLQKHFTWPGTAEGLPNTLDVLYAQEDMWVLQALTGIVKRTNGPVTTAHRAKVRRIISIKIGSQAIPNPATIEIPTAIGGEEDAGEAPPAETPPPPADDSSSPPSDTPEGTVVAAGDDPAEERYVDKNYKPLPAQKLREVMVATSLTPEDAYLAVAKRIPIRMMVRLDQRAVNDLLVECANSHPTVEIRQVRMPDSATATTKSPTDFTTTTDRTPAVDESAFPFDVSLEVYGIVYLYNTVPSSVDSAKSVFGVGGESAGEDGATEDGAAMDEAL